MWTPDSSVRPYICTERHFKIYLEFYISPHFRSIFAALLLGEQISIQTEPDRACTAAHGGCAAPYEGALHPPSCAVQAPCPALLCAWCLCLEGESLWIVSLYNNSGKRFNPTSMGRDDELMLNSLTIVETFLKPPCYGNEPPGGRKPEMKC